MFLNLFIKKYDELVDDSIIIIDKTVVKIEERGVNSEANSRRNKIALKKDNRRFFNEVWENCKDLEESSYEHQC